MAWDEATHEQYSRSRKRYETDVTDEGWEVTAPLLPEPSWKGRPRTGGHDRGREIGKPGNEVRLVPSICVKPLVKRARRG